MADISHGIKTESIKSFQSAIRKTEKALDQMRRKGTNTAFIEKRLKALRAGLAVMEDIRNRPPAGFTRDDLAEVREILAGLIPSLREILARLGNPSPQRTLLERRIKAFELAVQAMDALAGDTRAP